MKVIKLDEPTSHNPQTVHVNGRTLLFALNEKTKLTNQQIDTLEKGAVVNTRLAISMASPMWMNKVKANELMPSMDYKERDGHCWLERDEPRFAVQRLGVINEHIQIQPPPGEEEVNQAATTTLAAAAAAGKAERKGRPVRKTGGRKKRNGKVTA